MLVKEFMSTEVVTIAEDKNMLEVRELMRSSDKRRLPVVDDISRVRGIITDADVSRTSPTDATTLSRYEANYLLGKLKVRDVMTKNVITVHYDAGVEDAAYLLYKNKINALPVVDDDNKLCGIITDSDIFRAFVDIMGLARTSTRITIDVTDKVGVIADIGAMFRDNNINIISIVAKPETSVKTELTIRAELGAGDRTVVLSFGGSLGARRVNEVVADLCAWEQHEKKPVLHLHATGQYGVQLFKDLEKEKNFAEGGSLVVKEYINNMPELLAAADLVISRAGALTLAELEAVGRAAVLIPSPNVAENHQYFNAMELQKAGAAVVIEEKDLTGEKLVGTVADLLAQPGKLAEMGRNARSLSVDDSLDRIAAALMKLVQKH